MGLWYQGGKVKAHAPGVKAGQVLGIREQGREDGRCGWLGVFTEGVNGQKGRTVGVGH